MAWPCPYQRNINVPRFIMIWFMQSLPTKSSHLNTNTYKQGLIMWNKVTKLGRILYRLLKNYSQKLKREFGGKIKPWFSIDYKRKKLDLRLADLSKPFWCYFFFNNHLFIYNSIYSSTKTRQNILWLYNILYRKSTARLLKRYLDLRVGIYLSYFHILPMGIWQTMTRLILNTFK